MPARRLPHFRHIPPAFTSLATLGELWVSALFTASSDEQDIPRWPRKRAADLGIAQDQRAAKGPAAEMWHLEAGDDDMPTPPPTLRSGEEHHV
ncbi:hypothetical protein D9619_012859 [Psilocybe cf. subviscida]|nr:hypothetical protein D9619_012859 [Psilocybe cf. subviscida]